MENKNIVKLTCEDCGGTMDIDSDRKVMVCPFCGSKKIVLESDEVKIAHIQAEAEIEKQRLANDLEKSKQEEAKRKDEEDNKNFLIGVGILIVIIIFCFLFGLFI